MIIIDRRHLAWAFRRMRHNRKLSQHQLANRLHVVPNTIGYREGGNVRMDLDAILATAHVFGYDVALIPKRRRHARPTGTGWPA